MWNHLAVELTQELGRRITAVTDDPRETGFLLIIIIIIIIQHLYSAMESEDTEALGGARLRHVKQMSF